MARQRRESAAEILRRRGAKPLEYLADRFRDMETGPEKDALAKDLLPYYVPKLKAVEHKAGEGATVTVTIGQASPTVGEQDKADDGD